MGIRGLGEILLRWWCWAGDWVLIDLSNWLINFQVNTGRRRMRTYVGAKKSKSNLKLDTPEAKITKLENNEKVGYCGVFYENCNFRWKQNEMWTPKNGCRCSILNIKTNGYVFRLIDSYWLIDYRQPKTYGDHEHHVYGQPNNLCSCTSANIIMRWASWFIFA